MKLQSDSSKISIKKKKKQTKKTLPKNVFEIVGDSGQLVERVDSNKPEKKTAKTSEIEPKQKFSERTTKRRRREWDEMNYEPFDITRRRDFEKSLQRTATRGIVQLFNTVRKQQQQHSTSTSKKKDTGINKGEFLDMLKNIDSDETSYKIIKKTQSPSETTATKEKSVRWNVLHDDLMASVKDDDNDDDDDN